QCCGDPRDLPSFPTRRSSDLPVAARVSRRGAAASRRRCAVRSGADGGTGAAVATRRPRRSGRGGVMAADLSATRVVVELDKQALADSVATRFVGKLAQLTQAQPVVHVSLTGGSMGAAVLERAAAHPGAGMIDWSRVHFWWSDERFLPRDDAERNALQARQAMLDRLHTPNENIHEPAAADDGVTLDEAADAYAAELARFGDDAHPWPAFDVCFLGVGPDGHIASLFPDRDEIQVADRT